MGFWGGADKAVQRCRRCGSDGARSEGIHSLAGVGGHMALREAGCRAVGGRVGQKADQPSPPAWRSCAAPRAPQCCRSIARCLKICHDTMVLPYRCCTSAVSLPYRTADEGEVRCTHRARLCQRQALPEQPEPGARCACCVWVWVCVYVHACVHVHVCGCVWVCVCARALRALRAPAASRRGGGLVGGMGGGGAGRPATEQRGRAKRPAPPSLR